MKNIPDVKLGLIAVSRDCFPIALSEKRRAAIKAAYAGDLYECPVTVENELDMLKALADVNEHGCNALVVFLGNFGPETPETLIAKTLTAPVCSWPPPRGTATSSMGAATPTAVCSTAPTTWGCAI